MTLIRTDQVAESVPFNNEGTPFTVENVRDALIEALTLGAAARVALVGIFNGTISNNQWLGYSNLLPGDDTPIRVPWDSLLDRIAFSWNGNSVDGKYNLYKNGFTAGDIVYTATFSNVDGGEVKSGVNISLVTGDFIVGRWEDDGSNPSDMAVTMSFFLGV